MLGRVAIADADKNHACAPAHVAAERVIGRLVAEHPAAAVEIDDDRMRSGRRQAGRAGRATAPRLRASTPSTISPTGRPGGRVALNCSTKARAPCAPIDSIGGKCICAPAYAARIRTSGCKRTTSPSLHCAPLGPPSAKPSMSRLTTSSHSAAIGTDAAGVGHHPRTLPGTLAPVYQVLASRCSVEHRRSRQMPRPSGLRRLGRLDRW